MIAIIRLNENNLAEEGKIFGLTKPYSDEDKESICGIVAENIARKFKGITVESIKDLFETDNHLKRNTTFVLTTDFRKRHIYSTASTALLCFAVYESRKYHSNFIFVLQEGIKLDFHIMMHRDIECNLNTYYSIKNELNLRH